MRRTSKLPPTKGRSGIGCAIYTRKSSDEGLEQEFNSLDAQREACEAYIRSQKDEGWVALAQMYDDGGVSGGTMDRPALRRLLADIEAGKVATVVVYKVDRLTRSLGDFAKIIEVFDRHQVSFVSITQSFNTTTSMGRLTLNMLLSFAQFEREVTGERIRDKIAASKQKGMWMGGLPPLGYDVSDRKLVVNEQEAGTVRHIYRRYLELRSVRALQDELALSGIISKRRVGRLGRESGGKALARGALYLMLQNRTYRGEIVHKDASYPGEHDAIIDPELWDGVQAVLATNRVGRSTGAHAAEPSLLAGLMHDDAGERMTPTHANKKGTRYRYYVSQSLVTRDRGKGSDAGRRVPAGDVEGLVEDRTLAFLRDAPAVFDTVKSFTSDLKEAEALVRDTAGLTGRWPGLARSARRAMLQCLIARIEVRRETVEIWIRPSAIPSIVGSGFDPARSPIADESEPKLIVSIPARLKRTGRETKLLIDGGGPRREPDRSLLRLIARAQRFSLMVMQGEGRTISELAGQSGVSPSYFTRILRLSFLAPDIVSAIVSDRHPLELTAKRISLTHRLPNAWSEQKALLGMA
jgi:site-specific DNA recombinase